MADTHFDAVVVGSGFGGSVMAFRLAEAGLRGCVLERGKPYPPNSFAQSPAGIAHNVWDPSEGRLGMFDLSSFGGLWAVISSGLGGGSLIYANVMIRKDEKWFVRESPRDGTYEYWPVTRADLDPHYDRVEQILSAQRYPFDQPPYDKTSKTAAFRAAAASLNLDWYLPKLAVTFGNPGQPPVPGEPSSRKCPICMAVPGTRAGCVASATSAVITAARTRSTTPSDQSESQAMARISAPCAKCGRSSRARRAATRSTMSARCPSTKVRYALRTIPMCCRSRRLPPSA